MYNVRRTASLDDNRVKASAMHLCVQSENDRESEVGVARGGSEGNANWKNMK